MARPTKSADGSASMVLQMRITPSLHKELREEAEKKGRSLAEQAVRRLQYRESHLTRMVAALVEEAEKRLRDRGENEETIAAECRRAAHVAVEVVFRGIEGPPDKEIERLIAARLPSEIYAQAEDDAWAPYRVVKTKIGKVIPD